MKTLRVATCQFPVEPDIDSNCRYVLKQMKQAADQNADIAHFSECALSGYAGVEFPSFKNYDWDRLKQATATIQQAAKELKLWTLLGSSHPLTPPNKPHNSIYVIDDKGRVADRYDKRFCTGELKRKPTLDLSLYSPGDSPVTFQLKGITCGVAICYEYRFPELYRDYIRRGVKILFQSFHNARKTTVDDDSYNIWETIVPSTMACRAAENHIWISANNSTTRPSCWPSFAVRPDGAIVGKLKLHTPGVLITDMQLDPKLFDAPGPWRETSMNGQLHSGKPVSDPRSADRTCL
jgi:predicted amidohydrolase